jgi:uncharacterized protein YbjT (DUF2867 family)
VSTQLLEKGVPTRVLVHREDARSARLKELGAEVAVGDMFDIHQVQAAMEGATRLYFNPPYHPHVLYSAVAFAVAARQAGVEAVVALGQWLSSPEHPSLTTRHAWLTDKLFGLLPDTAHVAVDPGFFADNYFNLLPHAAQMGILPFPTGGGLNAPPSNEDIARVVVGALLDPGRHDGRAYRPTGPTLMSGQNIADAMGEALGRRVRHVDIPPRMFLKAIRAGAKQLGFDPFLESSLSHYVGESKLGTWAFGGPTTHVRDVAGVDPEDFSTIARRYATRPESRRTVGNFLRVSWLSLVTAVTPVRAYDAFARAQQQPAPAHPRLAGESDVWRREHEFTVDRVSTR